jgi:DNA-binding YbaB/EbfC family protein
MNNMFGNGNMQNMLKQAKKMQDQMSKVREDVESREFEGTSGGGAVRVVINGGKKVVSVTISPEVVDRDEIKMLEDVILSAVNDALHKVDDALSSALKSIGGGALNGLL